MNLKTLRTIQMHDYPPRWPLQILFRFVNICWWFWTESQMATHDMQTADVVGAKDHMLLGQALDMGVGAGPRRQSLPKSVTLIWFPRMKQSIAHFILSRYDCEARAGIFPSQSTNFMKSASSSMNPILPTCQSCKDMFFCAASLIVCTARTEHRHTSMSFTFSGLNQCQPVEKIELPTLSIFNSQPLLVHKKIDKGTTWNQSKVMLCECL